MKRFRFCHYCPGRASLCGQLYSNRRTAVKGIDSERVKAKWSKKRKELKITATAR